MSAVQQHLDNLRQAPRPLVWLSMLCLGVGACTSSLGPHKGAVANGLRSVTERLCGAQAAGEARSGVWQKLLKKA